MRIKNTDYADNSNNKSDNQPLARLFPNPAREEVFLRNVMLTNTENGYLEFWDSLGKLCKEVKLVQNSTLHTINISDLKSGLYFCKLRNCKSNLNQKIVIQK
jgi:hypothetical protein